MKKTRDVMLVHNGTKYVLVGSKLQKDLKGWKVSNRRSRRPELIGPENQKVKLLLDEVDFFIEDGFITDDEYDAIHSIVFGSFLKN